MLVPIEQVVLDPGARLQLQKRAETGQMCVAAAGEICGDLTDLSSEDMLMLAHWAAEATDSSDWYWLTQDCPVGLVECAANPQVSERDGGGSPFDEEPGLVPFPGPLPFPPYVSKRSAEPNFSIATAPAIKVELRTEATNHIMAREQEDISEEVESAMPASVKSALLNDPDAAESLAKEFSATTAAPQWYANMPGEVKNYYATVSSPAMMSAVAATTITVTTEPNHLVEDWISSIKSYQSEISSLSEDAASHSRHASALSNVAHSHSTHAAKIRSSALAATARMESISAVSESQFAVAESTSASVASKAVHGMEEAIDRNDSVGLASSLDTKMALVFSSVGAGACLALALVL
jgi:hypothetical protein